MVALLVWVFWADTVGVRSCWFGFNVVCLASLCGLGGWRGFRVVCCGCLIVMVTWGFCFAVGVGIILFRMGFSIIGGYCGGFGGCLWASVFGVVVGYVFLVYGFCGWFIWGGWLAFLGLRFGGCRRPWWFVWFVRVTGF